MIITWTQWTWLPLNKWRSIRWSVHPLFVLIMLASIVMGYFLELITLFIIVLVHELGHVLAAFGFGWKIREVKLLPFGGVVEVEEAGVVLAKEEICVAAAGPLQNVWMGLTAWLLGYSGLLSPEWSAHLVQANLLIGLFNLLPILPLDGGRIAQALLSYRLPYHLTLLWGARISLLFSAAMIIYSLSMFMWAGGVQVNLLAIGLFLFLTNWTYLRNVPYLFVRFLMNRDRLLNERVKKGTSAKPIIVRSEHSLQSVIKLLKRECYHLIYITGQGGKIIEVVPEERFVHEYLTFAKPGSAVREIFR